MPVIHVAKESFDKAISVSSKIIVVDFFAAWCGPCKMLAPVIEQAAGEMPDVQFYKVDVDESLDLAQRYQIMSVPTLLFFKNGELAKKSPGAISLQELKDTIAEL